MSLSRVLSRRTIHRGRVIDVGLERVELPSGKEADVEVIRHRGAAAILAVTEQDEILFLRQYRHAAGEILWEIPAGTREEGEELLECARRELGEEAGVCASDWTDLGEMMPAPGYSSERIHLFFARGLSPGEGERDEDEMILEVQRVPLERVQGWIADGSLIDSKSVVALARAQARGLLATGASA